MSCLGYIDMWLKFLYSMSKMLPIGEVLVQWPTRGRDIEESLFSFIVLVSFISQRPIKFLRLLNHRGGGSIFKGTLICG